MGIWVIVSEGWYKVYKSALDPSDSVRCYGL
jgi:hypothetical protein